MLRHHHEAVRAAVGVQPRGPPWTDDVPQRREAGLSDLGHQCVGTLGLGRLQRVQRGSAGVDDAVGLLVSGEVATLVGHAGHEASFAEQVALPADGCLAGALLLDLGEMAVRVGVLQGLQDGRAVTGPPGLLDAQHVGVCGGDGIDDCGQPRRGVIHKAVGEAHVPGLDRQGRSAVLGKGSGSEEKGEKGRRHGSTELAGTYRASACVHRVAQRAAGTMGRTPYRRPA